MSYKRIPSSAELIFPEVKKVISSTILSGKRIILGSFIEDDIKKVIQWHADENIMRNMDALPVKPKQEMEIKKWVDECPQDTFRFSLRLKEANELIGYAELNGILWPHRTSWITIAIADEAEWGKGYGKEAMQCLIRYAFMELNLYRLQLSVFSYNTRAKTLYESLGFQREGCYREFLERDGKRHDMYLYGLLRKEWKE
ncbi:GNAT family N-acetyltransferase [Cytobacillus firmus]|uniref:GNAT family N-acetyltransferase n=1 Tax=Cytobacillus firmus TaxID=1399 RepID=UPI002161FCB6|nr:GNAT family protein [Cytobacillus firmus]MCS0672646.1 GNAT family N-acetyltransferase [Cytobacillus firmus]